MTLSKGMAEDTVPPGPEEATEEVLFYLKKMKNYSVIFEKWSTDWVIKMNYKCIQFPIMLSYLINKSKLRFEWYCSLILLLPHRLCHINSYIYSSSLNT